MKSPFTCQYCFKNYIHKGTYKRHIEKHLENKEFYCYECDQGFSRKDSIKPHYQKIHPGVEYPKFLTRREKVGTKVDYKRVKFHVRSRCSPTTNKKDNNNELDELLEETKRQYLLK